MAHGSSINCWRIRRCQWLLAAALATVPGCIGDPANVPSQWPPADFELSVEEVTTTPEGLRATRSFLVLEDGTAVYRLAPEALAVPGSLFVLPVYRSLCAYRLLPETTRMLSRRMTLAGVTKLGEESAGAAAPTASGFRIHYRGFGDDTVIAVPGAVHGALVQVFRSINSFLPAGEQFAPVGVSGERLPPRLVGVPPLRDDLAGAAAFLQALAEQRPKLDSLQLDAFALACKQGDRALAMQLLDRWEAAAGGSTRNPQVLPGQAQAVTRQQLELFLPR